MGTLNGIGYTHTHIYFLSLPLSVSFICNFLLNKKKKKEGEKQCVYRSAFIIALRSYISHICCASNNKQNKYALFTILQRNGMELIDNNN